MLAPLCPNLVEDLSICLKLQALSTPPSASSLGEPDNPGPFNTNSTSREDAPILLKRRLEGIEDIDVQEAIIHTEKRVEHDIFQALKHSGAWSHTALKSSPHKIKFLVKLDIDYAKVALHNDTSTNKFGTQEKPHQLWLPRLTPEQKEVLRHPEGAAMEDQHGVLIAIHLPAVFSFLQVSPALP